ncbi:zinc finger MYND domain-containing protein 11-like isoform X1 [Mizuhopecten yessoensis]|uniref:zinc finger MYND domain-containing protein 11-like isoform X1 n=1 Tax=Mizuhopecten yessoensis TaxID=6573 RepID=UPI000B45DD81|nr:zinc finger MYND domain-containing protein 11-like isoform X1 [Mizuhopecten yessoensis]
MVRPTKRRYTNVLHAKHLLDAVNFVRQQKQIPNIERVARYMKRMHNHTQYETEKQMQYAVKDSLILSYQTVGKKGNMTGVEQEGFRIPEEEDFAEQTDDHDWYCFECHTVGDMLPCSDCWRVFHPSCTEEEWTGPKFTCSICKSNLQEIEAGKKKNKMKRKLLNTLLSYTIMRMKEKTRELHKIGHREQEVQFERYFVYQSMDLNRIEQKVESHRYRSLEEFLADTHLIFHNIYLIYGDEVKGGMTELARIMARDCKYDVEEIKQCHNCYYTSNAKPKDWFCEPCDPPHELVYAKLKGYSYWPAKIIRKEGEKLDVRFFGGFHQRALLAPDQIKPITSNVKSIVTKRTTGFMKASEELKKHQVRLAEQAQENTEDDEDEEDEKSDDQSNSGRMDDRMDVEGEEEEEDVNGHDSSNLEVSSTSLSPPKKRLCLKASTPEDANYNIVTSSEDKINIPKVTTATIAVQTTKRNTKSQHCQTDRRLENLPATNEPDPLPTPKTANIVCLQAQGSSKCSCDEKYNKVFNDFKERLDKDHKEDKEKSLKEQSDRLQKDFNEDKQLAVSRAVTNMQREVDRMKRQTEERCKQEYMEEMKKLAQKHKEATSMTKKKQWCYNCEEEAMYHCCWNTSYCSVKCQQDHWHKEHKRVCRRKR